MNEISVDNKLLQNRKLFLIGDIDHESVSFIIERLVLLNNSKEDIYFYICSEGGETSPGVALIDIMQSMQCDINTIVMGEVCSMASIIAMCGKKGKRFMHTNAKMMLHSVSAESEGSVKDMKTAAVEMEKTEKLLYGIIAKCTKKSVKTIEKKLKGSDLWLDAHEAIKFKAVDKIWAQPHEKGTVLKTTD